MPIDQFTLAIKTPYYGADVPISLITGGHRQQGGDCKFFFSGAFDMATDARVLAPNVTVLRCFEMSEDEVQRLSKIKCELRWSEGNPQQR